MTNAESIKFVINNVGIPQIQLIFTSKNNASGTDPIGFAMDKLISYKDVDGVIGYNEGVDTVLQTFDFNDVLLSTNWSAIDTQKTTVGAASIYNIKFNLTKPNNAFSCSVFFHIQCAPQEVLNNVTNQYLTPNVVKISLQLKEITGIVNSATGVALGGIIMVKGGQRIPPQNPPPKQSTMLPRMSPKQSSMPPPRMSPKQSSMPPKMSPRMSPKKSSMPPPKKSSGVPDMFRSTYVAQVQENPAPPRPNTPRRPEEGRDGQGKIGLAFDSAASADDAFFSWEETVVVKENGIYLLKNVTVSNFTRFDYKQPPQRIPEFASEIFAALASPLPPKKSPAPKQSPAPRQSPGGNPQQPGNPPPPPQNNGGLPVKPNYTYLRVWYSVLGKPQEISWDPYLGVNEVVSNVSSGEKNLPFLFTVLLSIAFVVIFNC
jgi:hypothetical protein